MPTIELPDGSLYYAERKATASPYPPLVLVHGAGGSHLDWAPEMRRLPDARVIVPDLPGHGRSSGPGSADTLAYARDVRALMDALSIGRAIIVGHSMGGAIAQQMAITVPDRVAGLILIGTGSKLPIDPTLPQRIVDDPEGTADWITQWAWSENVPDEVKQLGRQRLLEVSPEVLRRDYLACDAFDVRDKLAQINVPTLVLGATDDHMVKLKFSAYLAEHIPSATLVVIEGGGHMFPLEQPQVVANAVRQWLMEQAWSE